MPKQEKKEKIILQPGHIKAYRFVEKYIQKNVVAPEMEEIAKGIKVTIRHTYRIVDDLCSLEYIKREKYGRRSIQILKPLQ
jgi:hypothetical protein